MNIHMVHVDMWTAQGHCLSLFPAVEAEYYVYLQSSTSVDSTYTPSALFMIRMMHEEAQ